MLSDNSSPTLGIHRVWISLPRRFVRSDNATACAALPTVALSEASFHRGTPAQTESRSRQHKIVAQSDKSPDLLSILGYFLDGTSLAPVQIANDHRTHA